MPARIIDGKGIAKAIRAELKDEVAQFVAETGITPGLTAVLVGEDPASQVYVRNKKKAGDAAGIHADVRHHPDGLSEDELMQLVADLNADDAVHGILVQLPLPKGIDEQRVLDAIDPDKDVDGFHPVNSGRLLAGLPGPRPCTPSGILELLDRSDVRLEGKHAVVVGRSNIVGKPVALMLLARHATVTICHSRTPNLAEEVGRADVVVASVGKAKLIQGDWLKPGCAVIDVGINRNADGKLEGDVDFETAQNVAGAITPVPGGVGPMTIAMLLRQTLELARRRA